MPVSPPAIRPAQHPRLLRCLLCLLIPTALLSTLLSPLGLILSLNPLTLLVGLPLWLSSTALLLYTLAFIPYLLFAQEDQPSQPALLLPLSPFKLSRIITTLIQHLLILLRSNWLELVLDYSYRKIIVIGRNRTRPALVQRGIIYAYADHLRRRTKRLDIYLPPSLTPNAPRAPVLVFIHPGGWRWFDRSHFLQLGLRLRRLGFCVVIPDFTQFPEGRCEHSVRDIRCALRWVAQSISQYGGDPARIFVAGHGSGAHLSLLTVLESSIAHSLEEYADYPSPTPPVFAPAAGAQLGAAGADGGLELPHVEGMILLSGIYDPIHQLRNEVRAGWHQILALRRALGPSHSRTLSNSPAHLLHSAQNILLPRHLPSKFLIIHGGEDRNVPILQSHFISTLLENINRQQASPSSSDASDDDDHSSCYLPPDGPGAVANAPLHKPARSIHASISVEFLALKHLDHLASLFSLMLPNSNHHHHGYANIIVDRIRHLVG